MSHENQIKDSMTQYRLRDRRVACICVHIGYTKMRRVVETIDDTENESLHTTHEPNSNSNFKDYHGD
jgi:hypothetical protein